MKRAALFLLLTCSPLASGDPGGPSSIKRVCVVSEGRAIGHPAEHLAAMS